jgi:hypothetical protein
MKTIQKYLPAENLILLSKGMPEFKWMVEMTFYDLRLKGLIRNEGTNAVAVNNEIASGSQLFWFEQYFMLPFSAGPTLNMKSYFQRFFLNLPETSIILFQLIQTGRLKEFALYPDKPYLNQNALAEATNLKFELGLIENSLSTGKTSLQKLISELKGNFFLLADKHFTGFRESGIEEIISGCLKNFKPVKLPAEYSQLASESYTLGIMPLIGDDISTVIQFNSDNSSDSIEPTDSSDSDTGGGDGGWDSGGYDSGGGFS